MTSRAPDATPTPAGMALLGQVISGRYRILECIGIGGMGAVYLAEHMHMRKRVALKLLHAEMSQDEEVLARFRREAEAAAHVEHPNVVAATDFGQTADGAFFLVLEYVEGTGLRDVMDREPLPAARALHIVRQIGLALERAHAAGIVHRDLKPENVMLVRKGDEADFVKVLDFGIAKVEPHPHRDTTQPLTRLGTILGTPEYMAPEQALGETVGPSADLYAVGVMLYEMLTGRHPFDAEDRMAVLSMHIVAPVPKMEDRNPAVTVAPAVEELVIKLLQKDAKRRPASARELIASIESAAAQSGIELPHSLSQRSLGPMLGERISTETNPQWKPSDALAKTDYGLPASVPKLPVAARAHPPLILVAVAAGCLLVGILGVVVVMHRGDNTAALVEGGAAAGSAAVAPPRPTKATPDQLAAATTPAALEALVKDFPQDPAPKRALALALGKSGQVPRALDVLAGLDPSAVDDEVVALVVRAAQRTETADDAFALLEGPLGAPGVDGLVDLLGVKYAATKARAQRSLARAEVRGKASPAASVYLDLRGANGCTARHDLLGRAKDDGDARLLPTLKSMKPTRGCGFLGARDCWPCIRRDEALDDALRAIEARGK